MPQHKQISWVQLRVGLLVIVSLTVLAVGLFFISGQVNPFSRRYTLRTYFTSAGGVRHGTEVRLAGIPVGNVGPIRMSSSTDPAKAVEIDLRISRRYQKEIREDSVASQDTAGLLGESYIDISRGGAGQKPLPDNAELKSHEEADIKAIVQNTNDVISNLRVLSAKLNDITGQISSGKGTMGELIYDQKLYNRFEQTTEKVETLVTNVQGGQGTLGKLLTDESLYQRMNTTLDSLNQFVADARSGKGSLGKFISDPSVYDNVDKMAVRGNALMDKIESGQGTFGKLVNDPHLYDRVNSTMTHIDSITSRMDAGEGTLGKLSTDSSLFNTLNASANSLKEFLDEFRKNPKKYLTLRVHIF
jgi:phospholipid/cholesterol/gamma-HCH transport system substrate-binding protein